MRNIVLFVEDRGHQFFLDALLHRLAKRHRTTIEIDFVSARSGHGKTLSKLKDYVSELRDEQTYLPDMLIVATDGNCKGYLGRKQEVDNAAKGYSGYIVYAIPDPHIERWLLLDAKAFKEVLGKGCSAPAQKCERLLYKRLLKEAIRHTGNDELLGGLEYAEALVNAMDLDYLERTEESLGKLLKALRQKFQEWERSDQKGPHELREDQAVYTLQPESPPTSV